VVAFDYLYDPEAGKSGGFLVPATIPISVGDVPSTITMRRTSLVRWEWDGLGEDSVTPEIADLRQPSFTSQRRHRIDSHRTPWRALRRCNAQQ
jgi:hypothetical protein